MRLVKISHTRCDEWDTTSFALAPDDWTSADIKKAVAAAKKEYLDFEEELRENPKQPPPGTGIYPHHPPYQDHPDKTVREVQELHAVIKQQWQAWRDQQNKARQPFSHYLEKHGFVRLVNADPADHGVVRIEVDWGHHHNLDLRYDDPLPPEPQPLPSEDSGY